MTPTEIEQLKAMKCNFFASRPTFDEAMQYANNIARSNPDYIATMTAVWVAVNSLIDELVKGTEHQRQLIKAQDDDTALKVKMWLGDQTKCDICGIPFTDIPWFADARLLSGQWAIVCPSCHAKHAVQRFGIGYGQLYDAKTKIKLK